MATPDDGGGAPASLTRAARSAAGVRSSIHNVRNPRAAQLDEDLLTRTIADAGMSAFGAIFIEAWVLSSDGLTLTRPSGGHWMDPTFLLTAPDRDLADELNRTAPDCAPGQSLVGQLFKDSSTHMGSRKVRWRQIRGMMNDPFIQMSEDDRMQHLFEVGIGIVGAVPFSFQKRKGLVLFMSRATADIDSLRAEENEDYLLAAADLIGAAFAIRIPRMECGRIRRERFKATVEKVRKGLKKLPSVAREEEWRTSSSDISGQRDSSWERAGFTRRRTGRFKRVAFHLSESVLGLFHRIETSVYKWRGAGLHAAPRQSLVDCLVTFGGTFFVMLSLARFDEALKEYANTLWTYDPGWYASTLCIVFALTSAPVGQPIQIVLAHVWNALCGLAMAQIPSNEMDSFWEFANSTPDDRRGMILPVAWKGALAVAFGISGQAFLGIIHPPASGLSWAFATRNWGASNILVVLVADAIVIAMAVVMLNLYTARQYPMFWIGRSWKYSMGRSAEEGWLFASWRKRRQRKRESEDNNVGRSTTVGDDGV